MVSIVCLTAAMALPAMAQVRHSGASPIALKAMAESLTVTLSANAVSFTLREGSATNAGNTAITAITTWSFNQTMTLSVYAYFSSATSALTDGSGDNIPSSAFQISDNGGAFNALNNTVPFGGPNAGLSLAHVLIGSRTGTRIDTMNFNINLSTVPNLPAGTYSGTLNIQAQAI